MSLLDNVSTIFTKAAKNVAKSTNKVVETSKLSLSLIEKEDNLKSCYAEIGKIVSKCDDEEIINKLAITEKIDTITLLNSEIAELKIKISELKNSTKCPDCGANVSKNSAYCNVCGSKLG